MVERDALDDIPDRIGIAELPGGWVLVLTSDPEQAFSQPFTNLAALGPSVACAEEEHVMFSEARGYRNGQEAWRVVRDCNAEPFKHVAVTGDPPSALGDIREAAFAEQDAVGDGVDYVFEIPPRLAKAVCGFRILDDWPDGVAFTELRKAADPKGPGFFARLFGRS